MNSCIYRDDDTQENVSNVSKPKLQLSHSNTDHSQRCPKFNSQDMEKEAQLLPVICKWIS